MKFLKYTVAAALITLSLPAQAGTGSGLVRAIIAHIDGVVIFTVDTHTDVPACGTMKTDFAFDGSTAEGKNKYALLLAAANGKKSISVQGTGTCKAWVDREDVQYMHVAF